MPGLSLRTSAAGTASYTPMTPAAANPPTANSTIAQKAYGITGTGNSYGSAIAGTGAVCVGVVAIASLVYLWWSLPR